MAKIPNKLVVFGAVAAAALVIPGMLGPLVFQEAEARHNEQSQEAINRAGNTLVNVQANVQANVNDVTVCLVTGTCEPEQ
jgi:hypothetical protein